MLHRKLSRNGAVRASLLVSALSWSWLFVSTSIAVYLTIVTLLRLQHQLRQNGDAIASSIVLEQGKTFAGVYSFEVTWLIDRGFVV